MLIVLSRSKFKNSVAAVLALGASAALPIASLARQNPKARSPATQLSPRTRAILARLDEPISLPFPDSAPFDDVLRYIKNVTKKARKDPDIPIYIDPLGLYEAQSTLTSTVRIDVQAVPLKLSLRQVLGQLGLAYVVKDDVIFISSPKGVDREQKKTAVVAADALPGTKLVLAKLEEPISMSFANEAPLEDVLQYIRAATKRPNEPEIRFLLDPNGLREVEKSPSSTVQLEIEGVPLKTTLRLMLEQLDLAYIVKDGGVVISSTEAIRKLREKRHDQPNGK